MDTLGELVHYCKESDPIGALMLTGEWGSGKTYLIENDLARELADSHYIVRVSLFGMNSIAALQEAVKARWIAVCEPKLSKIHDYREKGSGISRMINRIIGILNPKAAVSGEIIASMNIMNIVYVRPEVKDLKTHEKKRVVLVFDDVERSKIDPVLLFGAINDYRENQHFNTIIVANEDYISNTRESDLITYQVLKRKVISSTIHHVPDYRKVIHNIISERKWRTEEYGKYLAENEEEIADLFIARQPENDEDEEKIGVYHNLLSLIEALQNFYRIYYHMNEEKITISDECLCSFLSYTLASMNGIRKDGKLCLEFSDEELEELYPHFSADALPESFRKWIAYGIWNKDAFMKDLDVFRE